jgi:pyrroloquinoline-quinone synthase
MKQTLVAILDQKIKAKHLLTHPFYQAWSKGQLSLEDLRHYSEQYFAHVRAFPTYLSEMHSRCEDLQYRRFIASNLADEEATSPTHLDLWLDFAKGVGADTNAVMQAEIGPGVRNLIDTYRELMKQGTAEAAAALYCYEKQIPEVAGAKIQGLKDNYSITDDSTLKYFAVHEVADVEHSGQWASMLENETIALAKIEAVADKALGALWGALDDIYAKCPCSAHA